MWSREAPHVRIKEAAATLRSSRDRSFRDHDQTTSAPTPSSSTVTPQKSTTSPPYFPLSFPRIHGYLPFPPRELVTDYVEIPDTVESVSVKGKAKEKEQDARVGKVMPVEIRRFPENIRFKCADWAKEKIEGEGKGYDVIIAYVSIDNLFLKKFLTNLHISFSLSFSITKWIHLNTLNAGLLLFFSKAFSLLHAGGKLILEPQPFSSYAKSARLSEGLKKNFERLRDGEGEERGWRDEDGEFERVLLEVVGFERRERLGGGKEGVKGVYSLLISSQDWD